MRPDAGLRTRDAEPGRASESEAREFASALARVQRPAQASAAEAPTLVRSTRTRLSGEEAARALSSAWEQVRGEPPSAETLSILVGQWAHETGRGASMLNYNFGGLKGTGPSGLSTACSTREGWGDSEVRVVDRFRAYGSPEEGARDYVSLLDRRYPDAVQAAEQGDARGFVHALKARGYFTDNEASYSKSVQSLATLALRTGFDALGAGATRERMAGDAPAMLDGAPALAQAMLQRLDSLAAPSAAGAPLAGGALLDTPGDYGALAVGPNAFADEVNRAALLMSALRIADPSERRKET
jgi:mannosyl-glycoprotein endo-beta-N-acetylglucosaminidase